MDWEVLNPVVIAICDIGKPISDGDATWIRELSWGDAFSANYSNKFAIFREHLNSVVSTIRDIEQAI
jgi:hypothetical protein